MANPFYRYLKNVALTLLMTGTALAVTTGCDSVIYDDEGDCELHYRLKFRFDYNLLFADAFPSQVSSVAVYAFNPDGTFAWQREESGSQLAAEGYAMNLDDIAPGDYTLIGWCGMSNSHLGSQPESFTLPELIPGKSTIEELKCRMEREIHDDGTHHSSTNLWPLFHGTTTDVKIYDPDGPEADGRTIVYNMPLVKNTNRVRVILQQLSGDDINAENFTYEIETANGLMAHHNGLLDDPKITYHPWKQGYGTGAIFLDPDNVTDIGKPANVKVAVADLTVARLITDEETILTVYRPDINSPGGRKIVARLPLVDYALLTKGNYDRPMTDQEFLDREDTYTLTFFLDRNQEWINTTIYINSWRVLLNNVDIN